MTQLGFLSDAWLAALAQRGAALPACEGVDLIVQHEITGAPDGKVRFVIEWRQGQIARAAAEIEQGLARTRPQPGDRLALPQPVQAEAEQVVEKVVARGNLLEQGLHLLRLPRLKAAHPRGARWSRG